jgi:hypothetical protein
MTLALLPETPARAGDEDIKSELLLRFKPGVNERSKRKVLTSLGLGVEDEIRQIGVIVVSVPKSTLHRVKSALSRDPSVDFVEVNERIPPSLIPNDYQYGPSGGQPYYLNEIRAPEAWDISIGSKDIVIAILDSGVGPHPDLDAKLLQGYNFYNNNTDTMDVCGHGTIVAGAAAAITNNGVGIAAIGWQSSILPVRVTYPNGYTDYSLLAKGLVYAADRGARVANISFQIFGGSALSSAAKYFMDKGGLVVAASGNTKSYCGDPDNPYIISVGGTMPGNDIWGRQWDGCSTYGPFVDLAAPTIAIYSTTIDPASPGGYNYYSGTSLSAALTAGLISLVFSVNPSLSPAQVEWIIKSTAVDLGEPGRDDYFGWGKIDAYAALKVITDSYKGLTSSTYKDFTPPTVAIIYPEDGAAVSGEVIVRVNASDDVSISRVELYKDGLLYAVDFDAPYEFYWDTAGDPDGHHTLLAKAYDASNNVGGSEQVTVYVVNHWAPITVSIVHPSDGSRVSGTITLSASASGGAGIGRVEFYVDDKLKGTVYSQPYEYRWNTKSVKDGWHTIKARAYDLLGKCAEASIRVIVSNRR